MSIQLPTKRRIPLDLTQLKAGQQLAITLRLQRQSNWCWAACIEMATDYKGHRITQCVSANNTLNRLDCCPTNPACNIRVATGTVVALCTNYGYPNTRLFLGALSLGQIANQISGGHPVYASIDWFLGGGAHMVLIRGWEIDDAGIPWVYVKDPDRGSGTVTYDTLVAGYGLGTWTESIVDM